LRIGYGKLTGDTYNMRYIILQKADKGCIYVDFDATLAYHTTDGVEKIGEPIPKMMSRVKRRLKQGYRIKIFTARATNSRMKKDVQDWLEKHGLPRFEVTNIKGHDAMEFWDDRARQVKPNTGEFINGH
jgi:hypothetical protein